MVKITMLETTGYGRDTFVKGESYDVDKETASALGPSCKQKGESPKTDKAPAKPAKDKMVKEPKTDKEVGQNDGSGKPGSDGEDKV